MHDVFFDFSFEHWPFILLGFIPAVINISIFIYVLFFVRKSSLSTTFLIFLTTLIMWRLQEMKPSQKSRRLFFFIEFSNRPGFLPKKELPVDF